MPEHVKKVDLVLEGGGVKNIALLGAVTVLAEAGYTFPRVAGTSGGAIIAAGIAAYQKAGRDLGTLLDVSLRVDNSQFLDWRWPGRVLGPVSGAIDLLRRAGLHSGDYLYEFLCPALEDAGVRTFGDLRIDDDPESSLAEHQRYSLVVHVADLTHQVLVRLPWDYALYGRVADEQPITDAVRASMSIPFFFRPVTVETDHGAATWVDGGLLANYPITVFDRTDGKPARWPTWGVKVSTSPSHGHDRPVRTAVGLGRPLLGDDHRRLVSIIVRRRHRRPADHPGRHVGGPCHAIRRRQPRPAPPVRERPRRCHRLPGAPFLI